MTKTVLFGLATISAARFALPLILEEGWFKRFFNAIGITASN